MLYILNIGDSKIKFGITTNNVEKRYGYSLRDKYTIIKDYKSTINHCFMVEQLIKKTFKDYSITRYEQVDGFGWTETVRDGALPDVIKFCDFHFNNLSETVTLFKKTYNLAYEENF